MWGTAILGTIGALIGGPIGAGIGIAIGGTFFDSSSQEQTPEEKMLFSCFFAVLGKLAKADGQVTKEEIKAVEEIFKLLELDQESKDSAIKIFRSAKEDNDLSASHYLSQIAESSQYSLEIGTYLLRQFCSTVMSDNDISYEEYSILIEAERIFRLGTGIVNQFLGIDSPVDESVKSQMSLQSAYEVLGCDATMDDSELKRIYRKKSMDFHPDIIAGHKLHDEFTKFANEQMKKVNDAYEIVCNARKM